MSEAGSATHRNQINWYTLIGPAALFLAAVFMAKYFLLDPEKIRNNVPDFVVLVTVGYTIAYSFLFLIAPELRLGRGLGRIGTVLLVIAIGLAFAISLLLMYMYIDRTFFTTDVVVAHRLVVTDPCAFECRTQQLVGFAFQPWFHLFGYNANAAEASAHQFLMWIEKYHFVLFVGIYTVIDLIFFTFSKVDSEKMKFRAILFFVDLPIFIAVMAILWLRAHPYAGTANVQHSGEVFEAGAIAFQFISGICAAYIIQNEDVFLRFLAFGIGEVSRTAALSMSALTSWLRGLC